MKQLVSMLVLSFVFGTAVAATTATDAQSVQTDTTANLSSTAKLSASKDTANSKPQANTTIDKSDKTKQATNASGNQNPAKVTWSWTKQKAQQVGDSAGSAVKTGWGWTKSHAILIGHGFKQGGEAFYHAVTGKDKAKANDQAKVSGADDSAKVNKAPQTVNSAASTKDSSPSQ